MGKVATRHLLSLTAFAVVFAALFGLVAVSEGVGSPDIPPGIAVVVEGVGGDAATITKAQVKHRTEQYAAFNNIKHAVPGRGNYAYFQSKAVGILLHSVWSRGAAEEAGISVTPAEVTAEVRKFRETEFHNAAQFHAYLKANKVTMADARNIATGRLLYEKVFGHFKRNLSALAPSAGQVKDYYEAARSSRFTQPPTRDVRVITNSHPGVIDKAKATLVGDDSVTSWKEVAMKYSEDPANKEAGGLQEGLREGEAEEPLNAAIFNAPSGRVEGPVKGGEGRVYVFEVERVNPGEAKPFDRVAAAIRKLLEEEAQESALSRFYADYISRWMARTFCAPGYEMEDCANFKGSGHPTGAPAACYEAHPKGGLPEACPAPVALSTPALPGSVSPLEPRGSAFPQRPRPAGEGQ